MQSECARSLPSSRARRRAEARPTRTRERQQVTFGGWSSSGPPPSTSPATSPRWSAAGRRTTRAARLPPTRSSRGSARTPSASSRASSTARRRAIRSRCRTARPSRGCRAISDGCGTASSAARSAFAGSVAPRRCRRTASATSATRSCPGSRTGAARRPRCGSCCRRRAPQGLAYVEITTDPDNAASQRVIEANGGALVERFTKPPQFGSKPGLRYRIDLSTLA